MSDEYRSKVNSVVDAFYESAKQGSPDAWKASLNGLAEVLSSGPATLSALHGQDKSLNIFATTMDDEGIAIFRERFQSVSPMVARLSTLERGDRLRRMDVVPDYEFERSAAYNELYRQRDVFDLTHTCLVKVNGFSAGVGISRSKANRIFSPEETAACHFLLPHLTRALELQCLLATSTRVQGPIFAALDVMRRGVMVVDASATIHYMNQKARRFVELGDGLSVDNEKKVGALSNTETRQLQTAIHSLLTGSILTRNEWSDNILLSRPGGSRPLHVSLSRFSDDEFAHFKPNALGLMVIYDPETARPTSESILTASYGLTGSETRIAILLSEGLSVREIGDRLAIQPNTVRAHLKNVFVKTRTSRQSELVRLVTNSPIDLDNERKRDP